MQETHTWEGKTDVVSIFDLDVQERPVVQVDNREVVDAEFFTPQYALELNLFPPLRRHIEARLAKLPNPSHHDIIRTLPVRRRGETT